MGTHVLTGNELRERRLGAGLTTEMLGNRLGVSSSTVTAGEKRRERLIESPMLRCRLSDSPDAFEPYNPRRDGERPRKPHAHRRGEAPKTQATRKAKTPTSRGKPRRTPTNSPISPLSHAQGEIIIGLLRELLTVWKGK
jgi:hypothetical protein